MNSLLRRVALAVTALLPALAALSACTAGNPTRETIIAPEPVQVPVRVLVPVDPALTQEVPVYERKADTVNEYVTQAETNTAAAKAANAKLKAIREAHPE